MKHWLARLSEHYLSIVALTISKDITGGLFSECPKAH